MEFSLVKILMVARCSFFSSWRRVGEKGEDWRLVYLCLWMGLAQGGVRDFIGGVQVVRKVAILQTRILSGTACQLNVGVFRIVRGAWVVRAHSSAEVPFVGLFVIAPAFHEMENPANRCDSAFFG